MPASTDKIRGVLRGSRGVPLECAREPTEKIINRVQMWRLLQDSIYFKQNDTNIKILSALLKQYFCSTKYTNTWNILFYASIFDIKKRLFYTSITQNNKVSIVLYVFRRIIIHTTVLLKKYITIIYVYKISFRTFKGGFYKIWKLYRWPDKIKS